jgi:hypothetical protein
MRNALLLIHPLDISSSVSSGHEVIALNQVERVETLSKGNRRR